MTQSAEIDALEDDEQFCPRCFAGVDSSEHHSKCVVRSRLRRRASRVTPPGSTLAPRDCPECQQGKHRNCTETTLDPDTDTMVPCECAEGGHL